jgi:hypothetical protein
MENNKVPISTKWLLDSSNSNNKEVINSVYLIYCQKTQSKGTGFLVNTGHLITNWHVIENCGASEIIAISSLNQKIEFSSLVYDSNRDLAVLTPKDKIAGGLEIDEKIIETETKVITWGYPLAYNGPAPVLSVGYIAGFTDYKEKSTSDIVKHYIVNGALNPGNSGGPLLVNNSERVIGIVVAKHAPITPLLKSALDALARNSSGIVFPAKDDKGNDQVFVESQIVSMLLEHQRKMTQVMLGEAIVGSELIDYLKEQKIMQ